MSADMRDVYSCHLLRAALLGDEDPERPAALSPLSELEAVVALAAELAAAVPGEDPEATAEAIGEAQATLRRVRALLTPTPNRTALRVVRETTHGVRPGQGGPWRQLRLAGEDVDPADAPVPAVYHVELRGLVPVEHVSGPLAVQVLHAEAVDTPAGAELRLELTVQAAPEVTP